MGTSERGEDRNPFTQRVAEQAINATSVYSRYQTVEV